MSYKPNSTKEFLCPPVGIIQSLEYINTVNVVLPKVQYQKWGWLRKYINFLGQPLKVLDIVLFV